MRVLCIDADIGMIELTAMLLRAHGFEVIGAATAVESIQIAKEKQPHAIILNQMMADMDSRQICRAIREFSNVPIIMLSALNDPETIASALDNGADDFLVKPVPSQVLAAHLNRLIKRTGQLKLSSDNLVDTWIPGASTSPTTPQKKTV